MHINRVLIDILDWIRKLTWWRAKKVKYKPFTILSMETTLFGLLKKVDRDTPRALSTYILTPPAPPKYAKDIHYDYHICLDHLWSLDTMQTEYEGKNTKLKYNIKHSHCITILKASRWPDSDGQYISTLIFQGDYDFIGFSPYFVNRDRWAYAIFQELIASLKHKDITLIVFNDVIENARRKFLGAGANRISSVSYIYDKDGNIGI